MEDKDSSMMACSLLELPKEICLVILSKLAFRDLCRCALVSKFLGSIAVHKELWKKRFEQDYAPGILDMVHCNLKDAYANLHCELNQKPQLINFKVIFTDGGEYPGGYGPSNMLQNNNNAEDSSFFGPCYCTENGKQFNVNMILEHAMESSVFFAQEIVVEGPSSGYTAPLNDGLVFFSQNRPDEGEFKKYDDMHDAEFLTLKEQYIENKVSKELVPITYFLLQNSTIKTERGYEKIIRKVTTQLSCPYPYGKYIYLKLLGPSRLGGNIDVAFFGVYGHSVDFKFKINSPGSWKNAFLQ